MQRLVVAVLGDPASIAALREASRSAEVVAVALALHGAVPLASLRDAALAAGARRCHALDVRETFAREVLLPAAKNALDPRSIPALEEAAIRFVTERLEEIAAIEHAEVRRPLSVPLPERPSRPVPPPTRVDIQFDAGVPVSINGVVMPLAELFESVETITGESALAVLQRGYAELGRS